MIELLLLPLLVICAVWFSLWLAWAAFKAVFWTLGSLFGLGAGLLALCVAGTVMLGTGGLLGLLLLPLLGLLLLPLALTALMIAAVFWLLRPRPQHLYARR